MTLGDAGSAAATLARQLEICAIHGKWHVGKQAVEEENAEQVRFEAMFFAEAIRIILREAGLSTDWQTDPGEPDGAGANNVQREQEVTSFYDRGEINEKETLSTL